MKYIRSSMYSLIFGLIFILSGSIFTIFLIYLLINADITIVVRNVDTTVDTISTVLKGITLLIPIVVVAVGIHSIKGAIKEHRYVKRDLQQFNYTLSSFKVVKFK